MQPGSASPAHVTRLLREWQDGNREALNQLIPIVYGELRLLASRQLSAEWRSNRLQTTALVNEAYMKLFAQREIDWQNRGHFFAIAAQLMRRILIDHARHELRARHGGAGIRVGLEDLAVLSNESAVDPIDILALDRALQKLEAIDADQGRIVELRFFGGLTVEETAAAIGKSAATVKREWALAKGWLHRELAGNTAQT